MNATDGFVCKCKGIHNGTTCSGRFYAFPVSVSYISLRKTGARVYIFSHLCKLFTHTNTVLTACGIHEIVVMNIILNICSDNVNAKKCNFHFGMDLHK